MTFQYQATVSRVIDGDTVVMDIDLGFSIVLHQSVRLLGLNAREHDMPGGPEATANLETLLPAGQAVTLSTMKPDKYGSRYDADVTLPDGRDLSALLIQDGWAAPWTGAGTKPVPPWPRTTGS